MSLLILAGCSTPGPGFEGIAPNRVIVGKSTFDVRVRGSKAQAVRINSEWAPRPQSVMPRALVAIEKSSGCRVTRIDGDQVIIEAALACGDAQPAQPLPQTLDYECDYRVLYRGHAELVCEPAI